ncbi:HAD-IA family hydrolase [Comamonas badia]|jgi:HAD superfamily hydrolase (TIGR01509 family)|uniref:HAD-IA family hydrolase n=1 Tax=Comamonas badia TaxID=265291 RepID=UPI0003FD3185|nr:HAD-IA family hydrolase [Comamonas badia]
MTSAALEGLVFDVDGTLADTETVHLAAFNQAFADLGMDWHWDEALYTRLLEVSGGKERVQHYWQQMRPDVRAIDAMAVEQTMARIHEIKTAHYEAAVNDGAVQLRPGVLALIEEAAAAGLRLAIATTTSPVNIAALLRRAMGSDWRSRFAAVQDASSAPLKKPHPMVYQQTLAQLGLPAAACLAFEDSANGLRSALAAGLATVITPARFTARHDFAGALRVLPSLEGVGVDDLRAWRAAA